MITGPANCEIISIMHGAARNERSAPEYFQKQYRIIIRGELDRRFEGEFQGMTLGSGDGKTFLRGALDQSQLHGVLSRFQAYNLEIIEVVDISQSSGDEGVRS